MAVKKWRYVFVHLVVVVVQWCNRKGSVHSEDPPPSTFTCVAGKTPVRLVRDVIWLVRPLIVYSTVWEPFQADISWPHKLVPLDRFRNK